MHLLIDMKKVFMLAGGKTLEMLFELDECVNSPQKVALVRRVCNTTSAVPF